LILHRGAVVEMGATEKVFGDPRHAYTRMLLASVPHLHERWRDRKRNGDLALPPASRDDPAPVLVEVDTDHLAALPGKGEPS